jgi:hypothetical protein
MSQSPIAQVPVEGGWIEGGKKRKSRRARTSKRRSGIPYRCRYAPKNACAPARGCGWVKGTSKTRGYCKSKKNYSPKKLMGGSQ